MLTVLSGIWSKFQLYIAGGLLGVCLLTSIGLAFTLQRVKVITAEREKDKIVYQDQIKEIQKTQVEYKLKAVQAKAAVEKKDAQRKQEADAYAESLKSKYDALLVRYASAQSGSKVSGNHLSGPSKPSEGTNGSSESSQLPSEIVIPYTDAEICADNTARLQAGNKWAQEQGQNIVVTQSKTKTNP